MAVPTYNGVAIFGHVDEMTTSVNPARWQLNAFPGVNGRQAIYHGSSGASTRVEGILTAASEAALIAAEVTLANLAAGGSLAVFIDRGSESYPNTFIATFRPHGRILQLADGSGFMRGYGMALESL